jgi:hypothetical protein
MASQKYKSILRDLECQESGHPFQRRILQIVHYAPGTTQIVDTKTQKGALDDAWCPVEGCNSRAKDPNEQRALICALAVYYFALLCGVVLVDRSHVIT